MTQGVSRFIAHHTPSTMGLCRWTRSHCSIASLILEFPRSMYSLVNLALSFVVQEFQISFSFRSIEPSDANPSTRLRKRRTVASLFTKSSIKVRQKVSIPPNFPKQGANIRIRMPDKFLASIGAVANGLFSDYLVMFVSTFSEKIGSKSS